ncbi:MAG: ParB/RepB/Spo0J family partition protein [Anaerolineales bacterium]|nr:ParB/RepB/Spo0J family partition protein [Anaerolineales bacterium]
MKPSLPDARSPNALRRAPVPFREPSNAPPLRMVRLNAIAGESPMQVRAAFSPDTDEQDRALLESLASEGQRVPVLLLETANSVPPAYTPLDGHRRIEALRRLKQEWVQAVIHAAGSLECDLITLTANVRKHLTPLEQARAIARLRERHSLTLEEIARRVGLSTRYLTELRALLETDPAIQRALEQGQLRAKAALALGQAPRALQPRLAEIANGQLVTEADAQRWVSRIAEHKESPEQAARAVGLIVPDSVSSNARSTPSSAPAGAQPPTPAGTRIRRETALSDETAGALLDSTFARLEPELRTSLSAAAVQHKVTAAQLKLAAHLALSGRAPDKAIEDAGYAARHPSVRKLLPVVDTLGELRSLVQAQRYTAECADLCAALARQFTELRQAMSRPAHTRKEKRDGTPQKVHG